MGWVIGNTNSKAWTAENNGRVSDHIRANDYQSENDGRGSDHSRVDGPRPEHDDRDSDNSNLNGFDEVRNAGSRETPI